METTLAPKRILLDEPGILNTLFRFVVQSREEWYEAIRIAEEYDITDGELASTYSYTSAQKSCMQDPCCTSRHVLADFDSLHGAANQYRMYSARLRTQYSSEVVSYVYFFNRLLNDGTVCTNRPRVASGAFT